MPDHNPLLRKLAALSPLSDEDRRHLAQVAAHPVAVPARTDLIREGDTPRGVFLVLGRGVRASAPAGPGWIPVDAPPKGAA